MAITDFVPKLLLDLDLDGAFESNQSAYLLEAPVRRGRNNALEKMRPGEATLTLQNRDGRWFPEKAVLSGLGDYTPFRLYVQWTTPAVTNIDENPSAETDAVGAVGVNGAAITRSTIDSWVGAHIFGVTTGAFADRGIEKKKRDGTRFGVTAGQDYVLRARVKNLSASVRSQKAKILWYDSGGVNFQTDEAAYSVSDDWAEVTLGAITAPTGAVTAATRIVDVGVPPNSAFSCDAWFFYQSSDTSLPYVDGDQPGCTWSGTAHESTSSRSANPIIDIVRGHMVGWDGRQQPRERVMKVQGVDRMGLLQQRDISLGNMIDKGSALCLHKTLDAAEGELCSNGSVEFTGSGAHPLTNYSAVAGATLAGAGFRVTPAEANALVFEQDFVLKTTPDGGQAKSGWSYDLVGDITVTGRYVFVVYARAVTGTVEVRFRILKDGAEPIASFKLMTLTTSWQRIELPTNAFVNSLGTTRSIDLVTENASATVFRSDALHFIPKVNWIERSFDAGTLTVPLLAAYHDKAASVLDDIIESEPGLLFITKDGRARFVDKDGRPATKVPRAVFGDGDGLLPFETLTYHRDSVRRVDTVIVQSRGTPTLQAADVPAWGMAPRRTTTTGEEFQAPYIQPSKGVIATVKGATINRENKSFGTGHDVEVTAGAADSYIFFQGIPFVYPTEISEVRETVQLSVPTGPPISVQMPLRKTGDSVMSSEATRLRERYQKAVVPISLTLKPRTDELMAQQIAMEVNDMVIVRAKEKADSPNLDKKYWVEGVEHSFRRGQLLQTVLHLEEA